MSFDIRSAVVVFVIALALLASMRVVVKDYGLRWLRTQMGLALIAEVLGYAFAKVHGTNGLIYNIYLLLECALLGACAVAWKATGSKQVCAALLLVACCSIFEVTRSGVDRLALLGSSCASVVVLVLYILVLWRKSDELDSRPWRSPWMLISIAHVLFFASATTLVAPITLLVATDPSTAGLLYYMLQAMLVLRYLTITIAMWQFPSQQHTAGVK